MWTLSSSEPWRNEAGVDMRSIEGILIFGKETTTPTPLQDLASVMKSDRESVKRSETTSEPLILKIEGITNVGGGKKHTS